MKGGTMKKFLSLLLSVCVFMLMTCSVYAYGGDESANQAGDGSGGSSDVSSIEKLGNSYPIVFVHGLFGWGNDELLGLNYWGGKGSLKDMLTKDGYTVYTPTIGPIASNYDRACELYAYLVGGTVDYGKVHSKEVGHSRYGTSYPGILPQLLDEDNNDGSELKIHLVGHSMGGETIRVLAQLLENGSPKEVEASGEDVSPLFKGGKHWIESITTICTPHDGSQEDEKQENMEPFAHQFFAMMAAQMGSNINQIDYNFRMDQWGLSQEDGESFSHYMERVFESNIWKKTNDLSVYDLSQEGAAELNSWAVAQPDIYYFSIACQDTHRNVFTGYQVPNANMSPILLKSSAFMGRYTCNEEGKVPVTSEWWVNDGVVSLRSAIAPHEGSTDKIKSWSLNSGTNPETLKRNYEKGIWNYIDFVKNVDHLEVVGQMSSLDRTYLQNKFRQWSAMLRSL